MASNVRREVITREYYPGEAGGGMKQTAAQGHNGDTQLAHVNPWEEALLKKLGGAGTRNPHTGLKQFYTASGEGSWNLYPDANATYDNVALPSNQHWLYNAQTGERRAATNGPATLAQIPAYAAANPGTGIQGSSGFSTPGETYADLSKIGTGTGGYSVYNPTINEWPPYGDGGGNSILPLDPATGLPYKNEWPPYGSAGTIFNPSSPLYGGGESVNPIDPATGLPYKNEWPPYGSAGTIFNPSSPLYGGGESVNPIDPATGLPYKNEWPPNGAPVTGETAGPGGWSLPNVDPTTGQPYSTASVSAPASATTSATSGATAAQNITTDYQNYFANTPVGTVTQWAGGTLTMGAGGTATYRDAAGNTTPLTASTSLATLYNSVPGIKAQWDQQYGLGSTATTGTTGTTTSTGVPGTTSDFFNIPTDIMPTSRTGLPSKYQDQLLASLMPEILSAIQNMSGNIDTYTNEALGSYQQQMQNALQKNIPTAIGNLSNRGILNSTEGQNILGNVYSAAATDAAGKGYETAMQAALLKSQMPTTLSSIGSQLGTSSTASDPTVMYRTMADLIKSMM
jgi:hypothetical protein